MPPFNKAPDHVVRFFNDGVSGLPGVELRKMFGYPCAFLNGQMLAGVFADRVMIRLSDADRARILLMPGARPFEPVPGRVMREYVELPDAVMKSSAQFKEWLGCGLKYVETLPPKAKKTRKAKS